MDLTSQQNSSYDDQINNIMVFLFQHEKLEIKQRDYSEILKQFLALDLAANYVLFSLIEESLPHRAKLLFAGENYQGKKQTVIEVLAHVAHVPCDHK